MAAPNYSVVYSGGLGSAPSTRTFAQMGVTAATFVSAAGGGDYADITVDTSITEQGMPFVPLARHAIYDSSGQLRFVGWLMEPARKATPERHQQTFRLEGPNSRLAQRTFQQPWNYAVDPTSYESDLAALYVPKVLLNLQDSVTGTRVDVAAQIREVLAYYRGLYPSNTAPIDFGSLDAIPAVQPPEDEQADTTCDIIIQRQLRWVPKVTAYWTYPTTNPPVPILNFSANDAVPAANIAGNVAIVPGVGLITLQGYQSILIDPTSGTLASFQSKPRYDLLVSKVFVFYQAEQEVGADVDWNTVVGAAVGVRNGGSDLLLGSRSIIQQISRDLVTGTTTYQAGPPSHLGINDITSLTRFTKSRNAGRNSGASGGGGYSKAGGPNQKDTGKKTLPDQGGGGGRGGGLWWAVAANGLPAFSQIPSTPPVLSLPPGAFIQNPT